VPREKAYGEGLDCMDDLHTGKVGERGEKEADKLGKEVRKEVSGWRWGKKGMGGGESLTAEKKAI